MEINETLLDERLAALESARTWRPRVVSKLEAHIRAADDTVVERDRGSPDSVVVDGWDECIVVLHFSSVVGKEPNDV